MNLLLRKNLLLAIACALVSLLALSACGGDDDDTGGDGGSTATATDDSGDGDDGGDDTATETEDAGEPTDDGGDDGDDVGGILTGSDANPAACELLTTDEIIEETGFEVGDGEPQEYAEGFYGCSWGSENFDSVDITMLSEGGEGLYEFNNDNAEEIDGLGDQAQYSSEFLAILEVLDGDYYLSVAVNSSTAEAGAIREAVLNLARIALDRLP